MNRSKKFQHITDADLMHQGNWDNDIDFIHVHGHSNNSLNNQCDHLAKTYNTHYPRLALKLNSKTPATTNKKTHDYYRIRDVDHAWSNRRLTPQFIELASHLHHILQDIGNLKLHHPTTCQPPRAFITSEIESEIIDQTPTPKPTSTIPDKDKYEPTEHEEQTQRDLMDSFIDEDWKETNLLTKVEIDNEQDAGHLSLTTSTDDDAIYSRDSID